MEKEKITFEDFNKIEFKLGVIKECFKHPNADRLLVFKIDIGEKEPRQIISSISEFYDPKDVINKRVVVVSNLKKAIFRGMESDGMLMCASLPNDADVELLTITKDFDAGSVIN